MVYMVYILCKCSSLAWRCSGMWKIDFHCFKIDFFQQFLRGEFHSSRQARFREKLSQMSRPWQAIQGRRHEDVTPRCWQSGKLRTLRTIESWEFRIILKNLVQRHVDFWHWCERQTYVLCRVLCFAPFEVCGKHPSLQILYKYRHAKKYKDSFNSNDVVIVKRSETVIHQSDRSRWRQWCWKRPSSSQSLTTFWDTFKTLSALSGYPSNDLNTLNSL